MSLKIWLPLNGDLINQGIFDTTIANIGVTYNDNGKIGKCGYFNGSSYLTGTMDYTGFTEFSLAFWFKVTTAPSTWAIVCNWGKANGYANEFFNAVLNGTNLYLVTANGSSYVSDCRTSYTVGEWHHFVGTYQNRCLQIYLDGVLKTSKTNITFDPSPNGSKVFGVGAAPNGAEKYTGYVNDVRMYDHCLSASEIHELSLGLIAHYKLDHSVNAITNAYSIPTFNTSAAAGGWNHWGQSGASGTYGQNTNKEYIYDKSQSYSHWWADAASATGNFLLYQSPTFAGGYRSLSAILKEENSKPITEDIVYPTWNANVSDGATLNKWTRVIPLGDGFYLGQVDGVHQDGSNDLIGFYIKPGYKVYISQAWLENDKEYCSDVLFPLTQVIDSSGYEQNGTPTGGITVSIDTARYERCLHFDGSTGYVTLPSFSLDMDDVTFSVFGKWSAFNGWSRLFELSTHANQNGNHIMIANNSTTSTLSVSGRINSSATLFPDISIGTITLEKWVHVAVTIKDRLLSAYVDGVLAKTYTFSEDYPRSNFASNFIGKSNWSSDKLFSGSISDVRIYATALSADDVKKLYDLGMKVDNAQRAHIFDVAEIGGTNLVTGYVAGGQTTVLDNGVKTSGTNSDTYFRLQLSEALVAGQSYTISCNASGVPAGKSWCFPVGGQSSATTKFYITNGYNEYTFTAASGFVGNPLMMDDLNSDNAVRTSIATFTDFRLVTANNSTFSVKKTGEVIADYYTEGVDHAGIYSAGGFAANSLIEI